MAKNNRAEPGRKSAGKKGDAARPPQAEEQGKPKRKLKEIAGVKVPKDLREVAAAAQKLAENPLVREIVTAGVMAAMAALSEAQQEAKERRAVGPEEGAEGEQKAKNRSTAKVVAAAAAGAISKRLISEAKSRGPDLLAKLESLAEGSGKQLIGGGKAANTDANDNQADDDDEAEDTGGTGGGRAEAGANI